MKCLHSLILLIKQWEKVWNISQKNNTKIIEEQEISKTYLRNDKKNE